VYLTEAEIAQIIIFRKFTEDVKITKFINILYTYVANRVFI